VACPLCFKDILKDNIPSGNLPAGIAIHINGPKTDSLKIPTSQIKNIQVFRE
jgi:hypothetical protein